MIDCWGSWHSPNMRKTMNLAVLALLSVSCTVDDGDELGDPSESGETTAAPTSESETSGETSDSETSGETEESGETGDPDEDEHWCEACEAPPPAGDACPPSESVGWWSLSVPDDGNHDLDESCLVVTATPESVVLDCPTYSPEIGLHLESPWTPTLEQGESVRFIADLNDNTQNIAYNFDFRIEHEDQTLALAGSDVNYAIEGVGVGALPFEEVAGACAPTCDDDTLVTEKVGLAFELEGGTETLFGGQHAVLGELEVWVSYAYLRLCEAPPSSDTHRYLQVLVSGT